MSSSAWKFLNRIDRLQYLGKKKKKTEQNLAFPPNFFSSNLSTTPKYQGVNFN